MELLVKKLCSETILPQKAYDSDAGFDLFSCTHAVLKPRERYIFEVGVAVQIPKNHCGIIKDRSGNATKKGIHVLAGVIDESYRGPVKVCIINLSSKKIGINIGDKIAQMLIVPNPSLQIKEVKQLSGTKRDIAGFGSTDDYPSKPNYYAT